MRSEPIGAVAAPVAGVAAIVEWLLHTYVPDMPPGVVAACAAISVWALARPWTVSHEKHVALMKDSYRTGRHDESVLRGDDAPYPHFPEGIGSPMKPPPKSRGAAAVAVMAMLLMGAATADAQGIRERLEGIGRAALDGAVDEGLSQLEGETAEQPPVQPAAQPAPAPMAVAADDPDAITVTRGQLIVAGIIGLLCMAIIVLYGRQQRPPPPSSSLLADPEKKLEGPDPLSTYRLDAVKRLFILTFAASIFVQTVEVFAESYLPGMQTTANLAHLFLLALSALWAAVWVVFGPVDRYIFPRIKWYELLTGETYGSPPAGWKPMDPAIRAVIIGGLFYLLVQLMVTISMGVG